jgi:hypothetical protein
LTRDSNSPVGKAGSAARPVPVTATATKNKRIAPDISISPATCEGSSSMFSREDARELTSFFGKTFDGVRRSPQNTRLRVVSHLTFLDSRSWWQWTCFFGKRTCRFAVEIVIGTMAVLPLMDVRSLSPDRFTESPIDWTEARRQARNVYETYYGV